MSDAPKVEHITYASRRTAYYHRRRCEAQVTDQTNRYRLLAGKDDQCELGALYCVDGKMLCKRHAGDHLIEALVSGKHIIGESG